MVEINYGINYKGVCRKKRYNDMYEVIEETCKIGKKYLELDTLSQPTKDKDVHKAWRRMRQFKRDRMSKSDRLYRSLYELEPESAEAKDAIPAESTDITMTPIKESASTNGG